MPDKIVVRELTEREDRLIDLLRELKYGEVQIFVQACEPVRVEVIKESIKL